MLVSLKLLPKYVIIIYALGSPQEPFSDWIKKKEPFQIETGVPNSFRRRTFHVLNSMYWVRPMKSSASEPGLR